jgi:hypothetical protein
LKQIDNPRVSFIAMNKLARSILVFVLVLVGSGFAAAQNPVVVELFTSEGCSSCPPADAVLAELGRQPQNNGIELILLGEHVDYWNYIGWTDRFSSAQFSQRQSDYARDFHISSVYTPQMVIDGRVQFVGNNLDDVRQKIAEESRQPKPAQVTLKWTGSDQLQVAVQSASAGKAKILLAVTEDGLSTAVGGGENGGRTLHHTAVVRQLRELGSSGKERFETTAEVRRNPAWNAAQLKVAVLVQDPATGRILGAGEIAYPNPEKAIEKTAAAPVPGL